MNTKVDRLIQQYELSDMSERLADSWTGDGGERRSLRELAEYFNRELLQAAMNEAGMTALDGEVENTYRLLTDDNVSTGVRTQAETTLERNDVDPDRLKQDFVSHQAIHTYLTKQRGVKGPSSPTKLDRLETTQDTIQRLTSRLVAVAEKRLRSLQKTALLNRHKAVDFTVSRRV